MKVIQKINIFLKEVWVELKRVSWLSRKDIVKHTLVVLGFTIAFAAFLGALDYIFSVVVEYFVIK